MCTCYSLHCHLTWLSLLLLLGLLVLRSLLKLRARPSMSFVFCLRADGILSHGVTNATCVNWLTSMHSTHPPVPGVWSQVPSNLLPEGAAVCYFNASGFMEQVVAPSFRQQGVVPDAKTSSADTRPLIAPRLREENRQEWDRLWNLNRTEECPVCHEKPPVWDGPMNSDVSTRCTHWLCVPCWARIAARDRRCPICREDLTMWIRRHDAEGEAPEDSDESFSGEDDESVRRSMPLCGDGFGNIAIRYLLDIQTLVGIDGGLVLNRILEHSDPCDMFPGPPYEHEIFVNVGSSGVPITISDVSRALMSIPHDAWQRGRSYYWEGVVLSPDRRRAHIRWGS